MEEFCRLIDIQMFAHSQVGHLFEIFTQTTLPSGQNIYWQWHRVSIEPDGIMIMVMFQLKWARTGYLKFTSMYTISPYVFKKNLANSAQFQNHTWPADPYPHGKKWFLSMRMILSDHASCGACLVYTTIQFGSPSSSILGTWLGHEKSWVEKENGTPIAIAHWQRGVVCQQTLGFNDVTNEHGGSKSKRDWTNNLGFTHQQNEEFTHNRDDLGENSTKKMWYLTTHHGLIDRKPMNSCSFLQKKSGSTFIATGSYLDDHQSTVFGTTLGVKQCDSQEGM